MELEHKNPDISRRAAICGLSLMGMGIFAAPESAEAATGVKVLASGKVQVTLKSNPALSKVGGVVRIDNVNGKSIALIRTSAKAYAAVNLLCTHQGAALDEAIKSLEESITALTPVVAADVKVEQDRIAAIKVKLDAMKADSANLTKNAKNIKDYETAISWREITIKRLNSQITAFTSKIKKLQNEKSAANNNLKLISSSASTALTTARTICA